MNTNNLFEKLEKGSIEQKEREIDKEAKQLRKKEIFEKFKIFILNNNVNKDKMIEEILSEIIDYGILMKEEIIEENQKNPEKFISIDETAKDEKSGMIFLGILAQKLEKLGIKTVIERNSTHNELAEYISFMLLYIIMSGMIHQKKYDLYFDFGEKINNELLKNKIEQDKLNDKIKKLFFLKYKISECLIKIIILPSTNVYKITVFINSFQEIDINKLKEKCEDDIEFKELNNLIYLNNTFLLEGCILSDNMIDSRGNKETGWSKGQKHGGLEYIPPEKEWKGYGLKVWGMYDGGNNDWISNGNNNEWAVAYRLKKDIDVLDGFYMAGPNQICMNNKDLNNKGKKVGKGIYFSPNPYYFWYYSSMAIINGKEYKYGFMARIKPDRIRYCKEINYYWILNGNTDEIRPYRILIQLMK